MGRGLNEDENYNKWVKTRLREVLAAGAFGMNWMLEPPTQPGTYWLRRGGLFYLPEGTEAAPVA